MEDMVRSNKQSARVSLVHHGLMGLLLALAATGCFENNGITKFGIGQNNAVTTASSNTGATMVISNVTVVPNTTSSSATTYTTSVFFNTTTSQQSISNVCSSNSGSATTATNACVCSFAWTESNTTGGTVVPILRSVQTPVLTVQPSMVTCNAPDVYSSILSGTTVQVSVLPIAPNTNTFPMNSFGIATGNQVTGSFSDAQGNSYQNILRYTCYGELQRGMSIASLMATATNPTTGTTVTYPMASQFCVQTISSGTGSSSSSTTQGCVGQLPPTDYSAQAYYFNLYIRGSEQGDINFENLSYHCPLVKQALGNNGTVGTENKAYPLDSTFALSLGPTQTFPVGVDAYTVLSDGSTDPVTGSSTCYPSTSATPTNTGGSSNTLVSSCLGFAALPNTNGTCPTFRDANNAIRYTYRLRRFIAVYPPIFDTNGTVLNQAQSSDSIYVLDRPVSNPANPLQPYTMQGPKPCPFAYFDHKGVASTTLDPAVYADTLTGTAGYNPTGAVPGYVATSNANWTGKNVDGIQLPNVDSVNSCSAVVGVYNPTKTVLGIATVNASNPVPSLKTIFIRPQKPWAPHYMEDTSFLACAPQSSAMQDPPLHFAKDPTTGNVGYCAEVYPTQNPNVTALDYLNPGSQGPPLVSPFYGGLVAPFTSHAVKNSLSAPCVADIPSVPSNYPLASTGACPAGAPTAVAGLALHPSNLVIDPNGGAPICAPKTCDRTVTDQTTDWMKYPLLSDAADMEKALVNDISDYGCILTYDNNGAKTGKLSPSGGCCGSTVLMSSGISSGGATAAHLETDASCLTPKY
jgi:hypothetical protein